MRLGKRGRDVPFLLKNLAGMAPVGPVAQGRHEPRAEQQKSPAQGASPYAPLVAQDGKDAAGARPGSLRMKGMQRAVADVAAVEPAGPAILC